MNYNKKKYRSLFLLLYFLNLFYLNFVLSQEKATEIRAVWLTTVDYLDWPKPNEIGNQFAQQSSLINILNQLQNLNINTIFFQVRPRGNSFYSSSYEPWAKELTGTLGKNPNWDPLKFIIEEANKRGIEVHAWINICKIWSGVYKPESNNHLLNKHPEWCKIYDNEWWLDFGYPEARNYTIKIIDEIISNYDIDGLHFDYIRYPSKNFDDHTSYNIYGKNQKRDDWRRDNINSFLREIRKLVETKKPYIKIGAAPIGIYKNTSSISGLSSYDNLFQDTKYWLDNNLVDYITPQTYWDFNDTRRDPSFEKVITEWQIIKKGKCIAPGIGLWKNSIAKEIDKYINVLRNYDFEGFALFRTEHTLSNNILKATLKNAAKIPKLNNIKDFFSSEDLFLKTEKSNNKLYLSWQTNRKDIKFFNIYKIKDTSKILISIVGKNINFYEINDTLNSNYAISFTTRYDSESPLFFLKQLTIAKKSENSVLANTNISDSTKNILKFMQQLPLDFYVACYPNPFYDYMLIVYEIIKKSDIELSIYDSNNNEIQKIIKGIQNKGRYVVKIDGKGLKKGLYICRLRVGDKIKQKTIIKQ